MQKKKTFQEKRETMKKKKNKKQKKQIKQQKAKSHGSWTRYSNQVASSQPDYVQQPADGGVFVYGWSGEGMEERRKTQDAANPQPPAAGRS